MATPSANKGFSVPVVSSDNNLWGGELNSYLTAVDTLLGGTLTFNASQGSVTLRASDQGYNLLYIINGTQSSTPFVLSFPSSTAGGGIYIIDNETTNTTVQVTQSSSLANTLTIPGPGRSGIVGNGTQFFTFDNAHYEPSAIEFTLDNQGAALSSGSFWGAPVCPFSATITSVTLLANTAGNVTIDIFKSSLGLYPGAQPSITGTLKPFLGGSAGTTFASSQLSANAWTTTVNSGDIFQYEVTSGSASISRLSVILNVNKT